MKTSEIPQTLLQVIFEQAEKEYPHECCGMILGPDEQKGIFTRVRPCRNIQDELNQMDPVTYTRTSATAYVIDSSDLFKIQKEARQKKEAIRIIYHSHIDKGAYFSEEDKRVATHEGEPVYPGVEYLVISVMKGKVADSCLYHWDEKQKDFLP